MLMIIESHEAARFERFTSAMFRLRKKVFVDQGKWDLPVEGDMEVDRYDREEGCVYLVSVDEATQHVRGSLRLMPTTGPHLMRDVFADWFEDPVVLESPAIWEVTRFCIDPDHQSGPYTARGLNLATSELLLGLASLAHDMGLTQVTGLCHAGMMAVVKRSKWAPEIVGVSDAPTTGRVYLGVWDVSSEVVAQLAEASGLSPGSLFGGRQVAAVAA